MRTGEEPLQGQKTAVEERLRSLYLDLMKSCLTNFIYGDSEVLPFALHKKGVKPVVGRAFRALGLEVGKSKPFDPDARRRGADFPRLHTP